MSEEQSQITRDLFAQTQRVGVDFINAELETGLTFAALAQTEESLGSPVDTRRCAENAVKAHREVTRRLPELQLTEPERQRLTERCEDLKQAISGWESISEAPPALRD